MKITTRINNIYYTDITDSIKVKTVYQFKKLTIANAMKHLSSLGIPYNSIINIQLEEIELDIPNEELENYIIK